MARSHKHFRWHGFPPLLAWKTEPNQVKEGQHSRKGKKGLPNSYGMTKAPGSVMEWLTDAAVLRGHTCETGTRTNRMTA